MLDKHTYLLLIILCVLCKGCHNESANSNEAEKNVSQNTIVTTPNTVVITVVDPILSCFLNVWTSEFQAMPETLYLGKEHDKLIVSIPTQQTVRIAGGSPFDHFWFNYELNKGDSVMVSQKQ